MLPARSVVMAGSPSSRCGSAGTVAEKRSPCVGSDGGAATTLVVAMLTVPL